MPEIGRPACDWSVAVKLVSDWIVAEPAVVASLLPLLTVADAVLEAVFEADSALATTGEIRSVINSKISQANRYMPQL